MSTEIYRPNGPNTEPSYQIGTADFEYTEGSFSKLVGDAIRSIYRGLRLPINLLLGAIDGNGAACPTYGLWGGAGWNAGTRTPEGEEDKRGQVFAWLMLVPRNISGKGSSLPLTFEKRQLV